MTEPEGPEEEAVMGRRRRRRVPTALDSVADKVLAYRPKPKSRRAKKRERKRVAAKRRR